MKKLRNTRSRRLQYEKLEARQMMAVTATLNSGVLNVYGSEAADTINFKKFDTTISIDGVNGAWAAKKVSSIVVNLYGGDDSVSLDSYANGGNAYLGEKVTIRGGLGTEVAHLAGGKDVYFGGNGSSLVVTATGTAKLNGTTVNLSNTVQVTFSNGVLRCTATNGNDSIQFQQNNGWIGVVGNALWVQAYKVKSIVVNLQSGNDIVSLDSLGSGANQAISAPFTINSGVGNKSVSLANGHDVSFSGLGHQLKVLSNGTVLLDGVVQTFDDEPNPNPTPDPDPNPDPPVTNWFDTNINDAALRTLGHNLYLDNLIDRSDIIALLHSVQDGGIVDATEFADLQNIVATVSLFGTQVHVQKLAGYVVSGTTANAKYQGGALGNLAANSTDAHLEKLINKWFLGLDRPTANGTYRQFVGQLFVNGASYTDVHQGTVGDCYFVASLAEAALRSNSTITNMFIVNGDGTYTVKFYSGSTPFYVTVDSYLPTSAGGAALYAAYGLMYNNSAGELWVALAEKAYAQLNEFGWSRSGANSGQNSYSALSGGYIASALAHITGQSTSLGNYTSYAGNFTTFVNAYNAGKLIGFASFATPASTGVVGSHAYAVVSYNATDQKITLFNPWGIEYGLLTMSWSEIQQNFSYFDRTV